MTICPEEPIFCGEHTFELQSTTMRSGHDAGWWLYQHASVQTATLETQVLTEFRATRALRSRRGFQVKESLKKADRILASKDPHAQCPPQPDEAVQEQDRSASSDSGDDACDGARAADLAHAMRVVHRRSLEGFAAWCLYVTSASLKAPCSKDLDHELLRNMARSVKENGDRPPDRLFAESLLLRVMESLGEQMLQCPERLSFLIFHIFQEAGGLKHTGQTNFTIDMDLLHDGLVQMSAHSNPYTRHENHRGDWELGLNFDDINESGIQCRERVAKTYKECASLMVVVDFFLCYRVPIALKLYCLAVAGYIFLGSHQGDDIITTHNGSLWKPQWMRINYVQYLALLDAGFWAATEAILIVYVGWQRWPSLGYRSPGIPGLQWLLQHAGC